MRLKNDELQIGKQKNKERIRQGQQKGHNLGLRKNIDRAQEVNNIHEVDDERKRSH